MNNKNRSRISKFAEYTRNIISFIVAICLGIVVAASLLLITAVPLALLCCVSSVSLLFGFTGIANVLLNLPKEVAAFFSSESKENTKKNIQAQTFTYAGRVAFVISTPLRWAAYLIGFSIIPGLVATGKIYGGINFALNFLSTPIRNRFNEDAQSKERSDSEASAFDEAFSDKQPYTLTSPTVGNNTAATNGAPQLTAMTPLSDMLTKRVENGNEGDTVDRGNFALWDLKSPISKLRQNY